MALYQVLAICVYLLIGLNNAKTDQTVSIPTSCVGLDDGYHHIKLLSDDTENNIQYPILYVLCSNEYIMIDYSVEPNWSAYFTTWIKYHYAVVGPIRNDHSNWKEWFLADTTTNTDVAAHYLVSPNCDTCSMSINDESAYYMSALAFGCFSPVRGWPACDFDYTTYKCRICDWDDANVHISSANRDDSLTLEDALTLDIKTGVCDFEIRSPSQQITQTFSQCAVENDDNTNWKPSLGIDGRFCQCYKPNNDNNYYITITQKRLQNKMNAPQTLLSDTNQETATKTTEYELYSKDFEDGTFRIINPGIYTIMEDIVFDFNAPPQGHKSPNNVKDNFYWPNIEDEEQYPGAMSSRDPFFLGFFAGITIECDNVILDLNGHELRMSDMFYYQQPFFSVIELSSQSFLPQQGPGFYGADPHFAQNVVIKNGVIGLSSHHGIHGNNNKHILIDNVHVQHFQTHGIQLNGFDGFDINNVDIGPSTQKAYLNGNYAQIRLLLPTMTNIAKEHTEHITFNGRKESVTMMDLVDKVVTMMDLVLHFVLNGESKEDDEYWDEAVVAFMNPSGLPMGAVLYGLFLNYQSAGIFGWHVNDARSNNVNVQNVYIHDLRHKGIEVVGFAEKGRVICNGFNGPIPAKDMFGDAIQSFQSKLYSLNPDDVERASYIGSIVSDIHIAMYYFGRDNFDHWFGIPFYGDNDAAMDWALGNNPDYASSDTIDFGFYCNEDAMFHPSKGLLGIKISGVDNVKISNVNIKNLQDETPFGSHLCGEGLPNIHGLYHFAQQIPYQIGFSMNMVMAITIDFSTIQMEMIDIDNIYSMTGLVYGFAAWFNSDIQMKSDIKVSNLNAGYLVRDSGLMYDNLPNKAAEACAIRVYDDDNDPLTIKWNQNQFKSYQTCIDGQIGCLGLDQYTNFGDIMKGDDIECHTMLPFPLAPNDFSELQPLSMKSNLYLDTNDNALIGGCIFIFILLITCLYSIKMIFLYSKRNSNEEEHGQNASELTHLLQNT